MRNVGEVEDGIAPAAAHGREGVKVARPAEAG
jgi:hypothetical protein